MKRAILTVLGALFALLLFAPSSAFAAAPPPVDLDADATSTFVINAPLVTLIVTGLIPVLNGFLTRASDSGSLKAVFTLVLNAVYAFFVSSQLADGSAVFSTETLYTFVFGLMVSITGYYGVYKPIGVTSNDGGKLAAVGRH